MRLFCSTITNLKSWRQACLYNCLQLDKCYAMETGHGWSLRDGRWSDVNEWGSNDYWLGLAQHNRLAMAFIEQELPKWLTCTVGIFQFWTCDAILLLKRCMITVLWSSYFGGKFIWFNKFLTICSKFALVCYFWWI